LLDQLGFPPESITDVVLTHGDFDHAGGVVRYPRAIIHLQRATAKRIAQTPGLAATRRYLVEAEAEGRLNWVDQSYRLTGELTIEHIGGHTQGSQVVHLSQDERRYVFVGDECYLREACLTGQPLPPRAVASPPRNRAFLERLSNKGPAGADVVLTCHDPVVLHENPTLAPGVVQIR
ncbi:MAG: MBL fold metallo-hydrolase, partial [Deltaproteobacteria bacterium]|nr:MBL fold metallo-hydrolase [Deltaproteobacteria bacterium]